MKKYRRLISFMLVIAIVFSGCLGNLKGIVSKAATTTTTTTTTTYQFMDYAGNLQPSGGQFQMHQISSEYKVIAPSGISIDHCIWHSMNSDIVSIDGDDTNIPTGSSVGVGVGAKKSGGTVTMKAVSKGTVSVTCEVYLSSTATTPVVTLNIIIKVDAVIDETLAGVDNVSMNKVMETDTENSIIMNYTSSNGEAATKLLIGGDSTKEGTARDQLNMMFANASEATWESANTGIVEISEDKKYIVAKGAGRTKLTAKMGNANNAGTWEIWVYVRPEIQDENGTVITDGTKSESDTPTTAVSNGAILKVSVNSGNHPEVSVSEKVVWVISKGDGDKNVIIRDSLGYSNPDYADDANLIYTNSVQGYTVNCKAGQYIVQFYVIGTYLSPDNKSTTCNSVNLKLTVSSEYDDKSNVTVNIGGNYNLSDGFNMTLETLNTYFDITIADDGISNTYVSLDKSNTWIINANKIGTANIIVKRKKAAQGLKIFGVPDDKDVVYITIHVVDTFTMNITETIMAVGSTLDLHGVIGSDTYSDASQFSWSVSDKTYLELSSTDGQYVTVTAKKSTKTNEYQTVTVQWKDLNGITRVATCKITITTAATSFKISPDTVKLEVGEATIINTSLSGTQNIVWMSSDTNVAVVEAQTGNVSAKITAKSKVGDVVITAYNEDNRTYATCKVTVMASVTSLSIDKGTAYTAVLGTGYVFMKAVYQPSNATEIEMNWVSTNKKVATVDENGTVTLLSKGETTIQVTPVYNPNQLMATCVLTVTDKVITSLTTDVTSLDMRKGDKHQVEVKYLPVDASETKLTWTSLNTSVAKVSNTGLITAVGVGSTSVMVTANVAYDTSSNPNKFAQAIINISVRNKLTSIQFASAPIYIAVGNSQNVEIVFNPANDVNTNLTWSISDSSIAKVTKDGVVTGVSEGMASLNVISEDIGGAGISTLVYVVPKPVYATNFVITPDSATMYVGDELQMETSFSPKGVTETNLTWSSSDEKIAKVDENGVITAVAIGEAVISAVYTDAPNGKPITRSCTITVDPPIIYATNFSVSPAAKNIFIGESFTITAVFTPTDTTNQNIEFQSLDESIATVTNKGVVKGIGAGDVLIQCQSEDGGFIATCAVHVENSIEFSLSPAVRELAVGKSFTPKKVTNPSNAKKTATWKSSNSAIAKVNSSGKVTGKKIGNCTITCTLTNYNQSAKCKVKVKELNSTVSLDKTNIRIGVGQSYQLKKTVWTNGSSNPKVTWESSNSSVVSVNSSGKITGIKAGSAKITVTTKDTVRAKAVCKVTVIQRTTKINLNTDYMVIYVGRSKKLTATLKPSNATIKKVKWTTANKDIARVTSSGKVRAISEGNTFITASATDGSNKKIKCYVKVLDIVPATSVVVAQSNMTLQKGDTAKISYTVLPSDTSDGLKFSSDNKRVATVNSKGVISAVGTGNAKITILTSSGVTTDVSVNVVALNKTSISIRQYDSVSLTVFGTTDKITWYSSNTRIATVNNGLIVGKGIGTTYIYAYINGCKLGCKVTITSVNS